MSFILYMVEDNLLGHRDGHVFVTLSACAVPPILADRVPKCAL